MILFAAVLGASSYELYQNDREIKNLTSQNVVFQSYIITQNNQLSDIIEDALLCNKILIQVTQDESLVINIDSIQFRDETKRCIV